MPEREKAEPNRRELTDRFIRQVALPEKRKLWWDTKQRGLCLQVQPSGHKSFKVAYRSGGRLRWYHIDIYGAIYAGDGTPLGGPFVIDDTTDDSLRPSVAWSPNGDVFLVAWEDDVYSILGGINGAYDIVGAIIDLNAGTGRFIDIYSSISTHGLARVGANHSPGGGFLVTWTLDYINIGDYDAAVDLLEQLSGDWLVSAPILRVDPLWDPLRNNRRFQALLAKFEN